MEPSAEIYRPSRMYGRLAWAALAGSAVCGLCAWRAPMAAVPGGLCALTTLVLFWLAKRPEIRLGDFQFNIGQRAIAWREIREINTNRFVSRMMVSPLVLDLKLTNSRRKVLIFPGEPAEIARLMHQLRKNSYLASFDGVPFREFWACSRLEGAKQPERAAKEKETVHILSAAEEEEIERMYQKLKSVGHLDSKKPGED
jgi:hypothetical protein